MNFDTFEAEERRLNEAFSHIAARVLGKVVNSERTETYTPPLNVWVDLPLGQVYAYYPKRLIEDEEYATFISGDMLCISTDRALLHNSDYQVLNTFRVNAEVRIKGKGMMKGRIYAPLAPKLWVVEFNRDALQRTIFKEDELDLVNKWRDR